MFSGGTIFFYGNINEIYMKILCHETGDKSILYVVSYPELTNHNLTPRYMLPVVEKIKEGVRYE